MGADTLTIQEIEQLPWYDLLSFLGLESFNWAGMASWDDLFSICDLPPNARILMIGCGVGKATFYLAEKHLKYSFVGIDLAEKSIEIARQSVKDRNLESRVHFEIADAHRLPFANNSFDCVFTEFMAYFLDHEKAVKEFYRVLQPSGYVGFNELMKDSQTPADVNAKLNEMELLFEEVSGYPLKVPSIAEYEEFCNQAGFLPMTHLISRHKIPLKEYFSIAGGFRNFLRIMKYVIKLYRKSPIIRVKFQKQKKVKQVIMWNRKTKKYLFTMVACAQKPT